MEHRVMPIGKMKNPIAMNPMSMIMPIMISILLPVSYTHLTLPTIA